MRKFGSTANVVMGVVLSTGKPLTSVSGACVAESIRLYDSGDCCDIWLTSAW